MSKAPNFNGEYPEAGERIGPLWQKLWDHMEDGRWYPGPDLSRLYAENVTEQCIRSLLHDAAKKGVLKVTTKKMPRARNGRCFYKRIDLSVKSV